MSWMQKLYETYENCESMVGATENEDEMPLLPICHTTQKAHIEIVIDGNGNFIRARVVSTNEARTVIPCTEKSAGRTSGEGAHPLCDSLQYIAGDYLIYGGRKKAYFEAYQNQLALWCESEQRHDKAIAVWNYIKKMQVIKDLVQEKVLFLNEDKQFQDKWDKTLVQNAPNIKQDEAFVRWVVEIPGQSETKVWRDQSLYQNWIKYFLSSQTEKGLCFVTGEEVTLASQHPRNIRRDGDGAKLISANDTLGFTYRGRFIEAEQACTIGYEMTQKVHSALRWLIARQGYKKGSKAIVAWTITGKRLPDLFADPFTLLGYEEDTTHEQAVDTAQELAIILNKRIRGYSLKVNGTDGVVVMGLDSATDGRLSITYYRELTKSDYINKLDTWHSTCSWIHHYRSKEIEDEKIGKKIKVYPKFVGAPSPDDISEAVYGARVHERLRAKTVDRILTCIIDEEKIPLDLLQMSVRRVSNRVALEEWEFNKYLSITCALYKKYRFDYEQEVLNMALDEKRTSRDYLYGRLLAIAQSIEQWALSKSGEKRLTNADRLMQQFSEHPYSTWRNIEMALNPYIARLQGAASKKLRLMDEVMAMFEADDYMKDHRLSGEYLLGYHCQREAFRKSNIIEQDTEAVEE